MSFIFYPTILKGTPPELMLQELRLFALQLDESPIMNVLFSPATVPFSPLTIPQEVVTQNYLQNIALSQYNPQTYVPTATPLPQGNAQSYFTSNLHDPHNGAQDYYPQLITSSLSISPYNTQTNIKPIIPYIQDNAQSYTLPVIPDLQNMAQDYYPQLIPFSQDDTQTYMPPITPLLQGDVQTYLSDLQTYLPPTAPVLQNNPSQHFRRALMSVDTDNLSPEMLQQLQNLKPNPSNYIASVVQDSFAQSSAAFNDLMKQSFHFPTRETSKTFHQGSQAFDRDSQLMNTFFNNQLQFPKFPSFPSFASLPQLNVNTNDENDVRMHV